MRMLKGWQKVLAGLGIVVACWAVMILLGALMLWLLMQTAGSLFAWL